VSGESYRKTCLNISADNVHGKQTINIYFFCAKLLYKHTMRKYFHKMVEQLQIAVKFISELQEKYGDNIHILDWALHMDEATPHIHERHVFDCENKYGERFPQQEKVLENLGFELPFPEKRRAGTIIEK
jgi:hypothetical protein